MWPQDRVEGLSYDWLQRLHDRDDRSRASVEDMDGVRRDEGGRMQLIRPVLAATEGEEEQGGEHKLELEGGIVCAKCIYFLL